MFILIFISLLFLITAILPFKIELKNKIFLLF